MGPRVGFKQLLESDAGVDLSRIQPLVPENGLDGADVGTSIMHGGGHRMAEDVAGSRLGHACGSNVTPYILGQRVDL